MPAPSHLMHPRQTYRVWRAKWWRGCVEALALVVWAAAAFGQTTKPANPPPLPPEGLIQLSDTAPPAPMQSPAEQARQDSALAADTLKRDHSTLFGLQADSARKLGARADSLTLRAIAARDTLFIKKPMRPERVRADRRDHIFAAATVTILALLSFLLYSVRSR